MTTFHNFLRGILFTLVIVSVVGTTLIWLSKASKSLSGSSAGWIVASCLLLLLMGRSFKPLRDRMRIPELFEAADDTPPDATIRFFFCILASVLWLLGGPSLPLGSIVLTSLGPWPLSLDVLMPLPMLLEWFSGSREPDLYCFLPVKEPCGGNLRPYVCEGLFLPSMLAS